MASLRVIGPGRAGSALVAALSAQGWSVAGSLGRGDAVADAAHGVDLLVITTPDRDIASVAAAVEPDDHAVVAHLAGSLGLDVLAPHVRRAALHPLVAMPAGPEGARQLASGVWFAVAGDPMAQRVVDDLGGRSFEVPDDRRAGYHAAACIAANHLVALLGQVERIADAVDVPFEAYLAMARAMLESVAVLGPGPALTGPAARGDTETIERHLAALDESERAAYSAMADLARRLAEETRSSR